MSPAVLLIAAALGRNPFYVAMVYENPIAQYDRVLNSALVERESWYNPNAEEFIWNKEHTGIIGTSWGLYQICDLYHEQYRGNIREHIRAGAGILLGLLMREHEPLFALSCYNSGQEWSKRGLRYAQDVLAIVDRIHAVGVWK
jgi:hypothetical protein